jgi:very-short-patch-repair endonuclease
MWQTLRSRQLHGYSVIRFENKAVIEDLGTVVKKLFGSVKDWKV